MATQPVILGGRGGEEGAAGRRCRAVEPGNLAPSDGDGELLSESQMSRSNCLNSSTSSKLRYTEAKRT